MSLRVFLTECRRSLGLTLTLVVCSGLVGWTALSALALKRYIAEIFVPVKWQADLMILPKGVTPEGLQRSLLRGEPEGLMPLALLETLQAQVSQEVAQKHLARPSLQVLGFIPFRAADGRTQIAYVGDREAYFTGAGGDSIWAHYPSVQWNDVKTDLAGRAGYFTPEWNANVLMGVLARGEPGPITKLKELIDRRTVAQGVRVTPGESDLELRLAALNRALFVLVGLLFLCLLPGLALALLLLHERRHAVFEVLREIGTQGARRGAIVGAQIAFLIVIPALAGAAAAVTAAPWLVGLLKFS